ncbi:MAG TPA: hypothetical protein VGE63_00540 [Candidatus Paceibacterota bacterium]
MNNHRTLRTLLQSEISTPHGLAERIKQSIYSVQQSSGSALLYKRLMWASGIGTLAAIIHLVIQTASSGLYQYLSLALSSGALVNVLKDLGIILLESLPLASIILVIMATFSFAWSLKKSLRLSHYSSLAIQ